MWGRGEIPIIAGSDIRADEAGYEGGRLVGVGGSGFEEEDGRAGAGGGEAVREGEACGAAAYD